MKDTVLVEISALMVLRRSTSSNRIPKTNLKENENANDFKGPCAQCSDPRGTFETYTLYLDDPLPLTEINIDPTS